MLFSWARQDPRCLNLGSFTPLLEADSRGSGFGSEACCANDNQEIEGGVGGTLYFCDGDPSTLAGSVARALGDTALYVRAIKIALG